MDREKIIEQLAEQFESPLYVLRKPAIGKPALCDKMSPNKPRTRYVLRGGRECTCLGWLKFERCKHLSMLQDGFNWVPGDGVPAEYAALESERLIEAVDALPSEAKLNREEIPHVVRGITLGLKDEEPGEILKIFAVREFADGLKLGINLKFLQKTR